MKIANLRRRPRIVVERYPNPDIRTFHVNGRIASEKLYGSLGGPGSLKYDGRECSPLTVQTAAGFYGIEGVANVGLDIYEVRITKAVAYDWEIIQTQVIDHIMQHFGWYETMVGRVLRYTRMIELYYKSLKGNVSQHIAGVVEVINKNDPSSNSRRRIIRYRRGSTHASEAVSPPR